MDKDPYKRHQKDRYRETNGKRERRETERRKGEKEEHPHLLHLLYDGGKCLKKGRKMKETVIR